MAQPVPTQGERAASHLLVGVVAGVVIHVLTGKLTNLSFQERVAMSVVTAIATGYIHEQYDAPVANYIALAA